MYFKREKRSFVLTKRRRVRTATGVQTVISAGNLDGGLSAANLPLLSRGVVAVVAADQDLSILMYTY